MVAKDCFPLRCTVVVQNACSCKHPSFLTAHSALHHMGYLGGPVEQAMQYAQRREAPCTRQTSPFTATHVYKTVGCVLSIYTFAGIRQHCQLPLKQHRLPLYMHSFCISGHDGCVFNWQSKGRSCMFGCTRCSPCHCILLSPPDLLYACRWQCMGTSSPCQCTMHTPLSGGWIAIMALLVVIAVMLSPTPNTTCNCGYPK